MKLPSFEGGVIVIKSNQKAARKCYKNSLKSIRGVCMVATQAEATSERRPGPAGEVQEKEIEGKKFKFGSSLGQEMQDQIAEVIARHMNAFAWSSADMPDMDPDFLCHRLTMDEKVRPVIQRRRKLNEERHSVVKEETQKLLKVGHIREIQYHEWLVNVVLVKKANRRWRMCVNFTDLNKVFPKDSYLLPSIDSLVDNTSRCQLLSFLYAFLGYNQICMHPRDKCKTTFMTELSSYCYRFMLFGLKNADTTYQWLMDRIIAPMIGRNVQAYVDDMVVTSEERDQHVANLE